MFSLLDFCTNSPAARTTEQLSWIWNRWQKKIRCSTIWIVFLEKHWASIVWKCFHRGCLKLRLLKSHSTEARIFQCSCHHHCSVFMMGPNCFHFHDYFGWALFRFYETFTFDTVKLFFKVQWMIGKEGNKEKSLLVFNYSFFGKKQFEKTKKTTIFQGFWKMKNELKKQNKPIFERCKEWKIIQQSAKNERVLLERKRWPGWLQWHDVNPALK